MEKKYGFGYKQLAKFGFKAAEKLGLGKQRQGRADPIPVKVRGGQGIGAENQSKGQAWHMCDICNVPVPPKKVEQHEAGRQHRENLLKYAANTLSCNHIVEEENVSLEEQEKRKRIKFVKPKKEPRKEQLDIEMKWNSIPDGVNNAPINKDDTSEIDNRQEPDDSVKLFVNNLNPATTKGAIALFFGRYGRVCNLIHMKKFAILSFEKQEAVDKIITDHEKGKLRLDGRELKPKKQK